jgi:protease I
MTLEDANPGDYDALLLPGGVANPDRLRMERKAVNAIRDFFHAEKPIAAICHAPWLRAEADVIRDGSGRGGRDRRTPDHQSQAPLIFRPSPKR